MLLAIDVGNTHTVIGVYDGADLRAHWRTTTNPEATSDEIWVTVRGLLGEGGIVPEQVVSVVVASVVPLLEDALLALCRRYLDVEPLLVNGGADLGIEVRVEPPSAAGADRLANAVAAGERHGRPAIVVDLGTATTFDVIDSKGAYLGGVIAPGVVAGAEELYRRAARLAEVDMHPPRQVIGNTTEESLRSELKEEPAIIFTGGLSSPFQEAFAERGVVDPLLTLEGLRLIHERNTS
jgi:type III pantothenate kinase